MSESEILDRSVDEMRLVFTNLVATHRKLISDSSISLILLMERWMESSQEGLRFAAEAALIKEIALVEEHVTTIKRASDNIELIGKSISTLFSNAFAGSTPFSN